MQLDIPSCRNFRISNLYSIQNTKKITRTLAIVAFQLPIPQDLEEVHAEIDLGGSIGTVLRKYDWSMEKKTEYLGNTALPHLFRKWMHTEHRFAAVHIYNLQVFSKNKPCKIHYCTILELHHPEYLTEEDLQTLYKMEDSQNQSKIQELLNVLQDLINRPLIYL